MDSSTKLYNKISFKYSGTLNSNSKNMSGLKSFNNNGHDVSKVALEWETPEKIGVGLRNLGNTCYLNSTLQSLLYTPPLANFFKHKGHSSKCGGDNFIFCSFCYLESLFRSVSSKGNKPVSPDKIAHSVRMINKRLRVGRQEDAHEFLRSLLDHMPKNQSDKKILEKIFVGKLRSSVECQKCKFKSEITESFWDLSLDIRKADSVSRCLEEFFKAEFLPIQSMYKCDKCKVTVSALKKYSILETPNVLTLHLKRFNSQMQKINRSIKFPSTLDISKFGNGDGKYELYSVLVHQGGTCFSGHYYSYVKSAAKFWYRMDDSFVKQESIDRILRENAYILFYVKKEKPLSFPKMEIPNGIISQSKEKLSDEQKSNILIKDNVEDANKKRKLPLNGIVELLSKRIQLMKFSTKNKRKKNQNLKRNEKK